MRAYRCLGFLLMGLPAALAQTPREQALKHVPEKAAMVAVVPSAAKLIEGLAAFGKAIGVDEMGEVSVEDMLGEFDVPSAELVDAAGPMIVAAMTGDDGDAVLICTLTDADKWKAAAGLKAGDGGLLSDEAGDQHFALDGNVLITSEKLEMVKRAVQGGGRLHEPITESSGAHVAAICLDVREMEKEIREGLAEMEKAVAEGMTAAGPQGAGMAAMGKWAVAQAQTLAADTQTVTVLADISADGVHLSKRVRMKPDSAAAGYLKKIKKSDKDLFRGLVDDRPAMCIGYEWSLPADTPSLTALFMTAMIDAVKPADAAAAEELKTKTTRAMAMFDKLTGLSTSTSATDSGKMIVSGGYFTEDAPAVLESLSTYQEVNQLMAASFVPGVKVDVKQSKEEIGGTAATLVEIAFSGDDPSLAAMMEGMYGGPMAMAAAPHAPGVLMSLGATPAAKAQLAKLMSGGSGPLSANAQVKAALGTIPPGPQLCVLIDLARLAQLGVGMAAGMGLPIPPIKFPETAAPLIAAGMYVQEAGISADLHVPAGAIKPVVDTIKATMAPPKEDQQ